MSEARRSAVSTATVATRWRAGERRLLLDTVFGALVEWREESATLRCAWMDWCYATHTQCGAAYAAYRAALEREAAAAGTLARVCERATQQLSPA